MKSIAELEQQLFNLESWEQSVLNDLDECGRHDRPGEEERQEQLEEELSGVRSEIEEVENSLQALRQQQAGS